MCRHRASILHNIFCHPVALAVIRQKACDDTAKDSFTMQVTGTRT